MIKPAYWYYFIPQQSMSLLETSWNYWNISFPMRASQIKMKKQKNTFDTKDN